MNALRLRHDYGLNRPPLLRAGLTVIVLVTIEFARRLLGIPAGFLADVAVLYVAILLGGLFSLPAHDGPEARVNSLDDPVGVAAFLLAPAGPAVATAVLAGGLSGGSAPLEVAALVLGVAVLALLALLAATALLPAETWFQPPDRNALALVANGAWILAGTLFRPGAVAAAALFLIKHLAPLDVLRLTL